jgi:hypothetical protein
LFDGEDVHEEKLEGRGGMEEVKRRVEGNLDRRNMNNMRRA